MKGTLLFILLSLSVGIYAQIPEHVKVESEPTDWTSPVNLVVLIGIPAFLIIFSFVWRARLRAKASQEIEG